MTCLALRGTTFRPQGCICVRRYPVCRERCGTTSTKRRGNYHCRRRQEALGEASEMEARRSYRKFGGRRTVSPVPTTRFMSPTKEAVPRFLMRRAISSLTPVLANGSLGTGPTQTVHAFDVPLQRAGHDTRQTLRQLCRRAGYTVRE